jgi:hypothetical protein
MEKSIPRLFREELRVLYTTGPWLVSRTLAEFPDAASQVKVLFPDDVCDPIYWNHFGQFGVHLMVGSWRKRNWFVKRRLLNYWEALMIKRKLKKSRKLGKSRSLEFKGKASILSSTSSYTLSDRSLTSFSHHNPKNN